VYPGLYQGTLNHDIALPSWDFTLISRDGPATTILDLEGAPGIRCSPTQTTAMLIEGFTFTSGDAPFSDYGVQAGDHAGCTIRNCVFDDRVGLDILGYGEKSIENCVFTRNDRGIVISDPGLVTVRNCVFRDNDTGIVLSSLWSPGHIVSVVGCDFDANTCCLALSTAGHVLVDSCSFHDSTHGPYFWDTGTSIELTTQTLANVRIRHCSFTDNHSTRSAGAITAFPSDGSILIEDCVFTGNSAAWDGGAILNEGYYFALDGSILVDNCTFAGNSAEGAGGAICDGGRHLTTSGCSFVGNKAESGGAMCVSEEHGAGAASISDCYFADNVAVEGGAVLATLEKTTISGCEFTGNSADMGAAVYGSENLTEIRDCVFSDNRAHIWGGGVCFVDTQQLPGAKVYDSTFENNYSHRGSAILFDHSLGTVSNCTLFGNHSEDATLTCTRASDVGIVRCISSFASPGSSLTVQLSSAATLMNSCMYGNRGGDLSGDGTIRERNNLYTDPLFCDISSHDYTLCANSPCLPDNNIWSVTIGAYGQGCGACDSPAEFTSWGAIKAMFR
jgi:hypothetical protein